MDNRRGRGEYLGLRLLGGYQEDQYGDLVQAFDRDSDSRMIAMRSYTMTCNCSIGHGKLQIYRARVLESFLGRGCVRRAVRACEAGQRVSKVPLHNVNAPLSRLSVGFASTQVILPSGPSAHSDMASSPSYSSSTGRRGWTATHCIWLGTRLI